MTFQEWLRKKERYHSPVGDLARDASDDKNFPVGYFDREKYLAYLVNKSACDGAIDAFRAAWRGYCRAVNLGKTRSGQSLV